MFASSPTHQNKRKLFDWNELKKSLVIMFPLYIAYLMNTGMGLIDTLVAGKAGETNLAGVAIGSSICWPTILSIGSILTIIGPMISRLRGQGDEQKIGPLLHQALLLACVLAVLAILMLWALSHIFPLVTQDAETIRIATGYVHCMIFGVPATIMMRVFSGHFEAHQQTRPAMCLAIGGLLLNFPLNWVFVFGWGAIPAMGGIGCGLASSIISCLVSMGMLTIMFASSHHRVYARLMLAWGLPHLRACGRILRMGIPIGVAIFCETTFFCAIGLVIAPLGNTAVSANQVALNISATFFMMPLALSVAASIRSSYHIGAGDEVRFKNLVSTLMLTTLILSVVMMLVLSLFRYQIIEQFTDSSQVIAVAQHLLVLCGIYQIPDAFQSLMAGLLRGCHDTKILSSVNICAYWLVGFPLAFTLIHCDWIVPAMGPAGAWVSFIVALSVTSLLLGLRFARTKGRIFTPTP